MRLILRLVEISRHEWGLLLGALWLLPMVRVGLRLWGFDRTYRLLKGAFSIRPHGLAAVDAVCSARSTMKMVRAASVYGVCQATCLPRSLVAWALLRRQGLDPELRLGARKKTGVFEAHAWIELGSKALDAGVRNGDDPFVPFEIAV